MPINLTISAESVQEFDTLLARFARTGVLSAAIMPEIAHTPAAQEAVAAEPAKPGNARGRKGSASSATSTSAPEAGSTPTGTKASEAGDASPTSDAPAVDPFATPALVPEGDGLLAPTAHETVAAIPAATSPANAAAAEAGEVTIQQLKDAMADLLKAKSASFAMQTLEAATGCKSLTSGSPSVVEKAKDDPTIFRKTLDALVAAKTAA